MTVVSIANSTWGPSLGRSLVRMFPDRIAFAFADLITGYVARQADNPVVKGIRANQAVVRGLSYHDADLDQAVVNVMRNVGRGYTSLFMLIDKKREELDLMSRIDQTILEPGLKVLQEGVGLFFAGAHTAGFDQLLLMLGSLDFPVQGLSAAEPRGSYLAQNEMRRKFGVNLTPIGMRALRTALESLSTGGIVATAIDRADRSGTELTFFGETARMPVGHARLCVKAGVPILVGYTRTVSPGEYRAYGLELLHPAQGGNEPRAAKDLAQRALLALEPAIQHKPDEWLMFHPVWPAIIPDR